jgi:cytochrome c oxidase subunit III
MLVNMVKHVEEDKLDLRPKKFMMWLFIITSAMLFAAFTSGFIVYTGGSSARGLNLLLPQSFLYSTVVILASSVTLFLASRAAKRLQFGKQKALILVTIVLGCLFFYFQLTSWRTLFGIGAPFVNSNASQSFIYVLSGAHLLHVFAGILVLVNAWLGVTKNIPQVKNLFRMEMASIFWHFLDIVWIYLYVFLLLNQ